LRLQSSLGKMEQENRKDVNMGGYTALGRVIKVHHKHNTADVKLIRFNDVLMGSTENEGRYACKILVNSAVYNQKLDKSSGVVEPMVVGQLVIVAFIDNMKTQPIIIGSMHRMDAPENMLTTRYPVDESDVREAHKYLRVFPSQDYLKVDGMGNMEIATHSKTFFVFTEDGADDAHMSFDFENLTEKDKKTKKTITMEDFLYRNPKDFLMVFRDNWEDDLTTWTKLFVRKDGLLRVTRDKRDGKLTYMSLDVDGQLKLRRQLDSHEHESGSSYSEVGVDVDGTAYLKSSGTSGETSVKVDTGGRVTIKNSKVTITISADGTTKIDTENCIINSKSPISLSKHVVVNGDLLVTGNVGCKRLGAEDVNADKLYGNDIYGNFHLYE